MLQEDLKFTKKKTFLNLLIAIFLLCTFALLNQSVHAQSVTATIPVGNGPFGVAFTPNGAYAYVTNQNSGTVSVISTATNTVTATVTLGSLPYAVAVTPNGEYAYVTNVGNNTVSVISTASNTITATVPAGLSPLSVTISPNGPYAYVTHDTYLDYISVISTATNMETANITVDGNDTQYVAFTPNGEYACVTVLPPLPKTPGPAPFGNGTVSVINTAKNKMAASLTILGEPLGLAISPNGTYAYVTSMANGGGGTVNVVSTPAPTAVQEFPAQSFIITVVVFMIISCLWSSLQRRE